MSIPIGGVVSSVSDMMVSGWETAVSASGCRSAAGISFDMLVDLGGVGRVRLTGTLFFVFPDFSCGGGRATCYRDAGDG